MVRAVCVGRGGRRFPGVPRRFADGRLCTHSPDQGWETVVRRRRWGVLAATAAPLLAVATTFAPAHANPAVLVYPGMEIHQDTNVCTLGFVDQQARVAFTAGHCRGGGPVGDKDGNYIGQLVLYRDNTPDGATIATDHQISDWEAIEL